MNGENIMDAACGYLDEFQQLLADGYLNIDEVKTWFKKGFITKQQYEFAVDYLK